MMVPMKIESLPSTISPTCVSPKTVVPSIVAAPAMMAAGGGAGGDSAKKAFGIVSTMLPVTVSVERRTTSGSAIRPVMTRVSETASEEPLGASPARTASRLSISGNFGLPSVLSAMPGTRVQ